MSYSKEPSVNDIMETTQSGGSQLSLTRVPSHPIFHGLQGVQKLKRSQVFKGLIYKNLAGMQILIQV